MASSYARLCVLLCGLLLSRDVDAAQGDQNWATNFVTPITGAGSVHFLASNGQKVLAAGLFYTAGLVTSTNCAEWSGSNWVALPGLRIDYPIGIAVWSNNYYVLATREHTNVLANWNGQSWSEVPTTAYGYHLVANDRGLFMTGVASNRNGAFGYGVMRWDGARWSTLGDRLFGDIGGQPFATPRELFVDSAFSSNIVYGSVISRWDGTNWFDYPPLVYAGWVPKAVFRNELYVGAQSAILRWDGNQWVPLPGLPFTNDRSGVTAMIGTTNGLYVAGIFEPSASAQGANLARWDGSRWTFLPWDAQSEATSLTWAGNYLYAGGGFTRLGTTTCRGIARWTGTNWQALGAGAGVREEGGIVALCSAGTNLVAAGTFEGIGGLARTNIGAWNGTRWSSLGGAPNGPIVALASTGNVLFAAGDFTRIGGINATGVARWSGSNWTAMAAGPGFVVRTLAVWRGQPFAGGYTYRPGIDVITRWDGSAWRPVRSAENPIPINDVFSLASTPNRLYALASTSKWRELLQWDSTNWAGVPGGPESPFLICADANVLWAMAPANSIGWAWDLAKWDGTNWWYAQSHAVTDGPPLGAMVTFAGDLYVGDYWNIGTWDGFDWPPLGSGIDGHTFAIAPYKGSVYFGGYIRKAGAKPSYGLAAWRPPPPMPELKSRRGSDSLLVAWPSALTNHVLETSSRLEQNVWSNAQSNAVVVGSQRILTNQFTEADRRFFRLRPR